MQVERLSIPNLPPLLQAYFDNEKALAAYAAYRPDAEGAAQAIEGRKAHPVNRQVLADTLLRQYGQMEQGFSEDSRNAAALANIEALREENTFTIITGHQLQIFTGPLFFIYKIASAIAYAQRLKADYPQYQFVPVYWMATEDHDFEEINHFHLWGRSFRWEHASGGPVGRMDTEGVQGIIDELEGSFQNPDEAKQFLFLFRESYSQPTLSLATRRLVHALFARYGLVILDPDEKALKELFKTPMREELQKGIVADKVGQAVAALQAWKPPVSPREINLFYLEDHNRSRIVREGNGFSLAGNSRRWSEEELLAELDQHPERFSPNVTMRPMYQESILPNLAYIGGPNELAYWLELKPAFDHFGIFYPQLLLRDSALWVGKRYSKIMADLKISPKMILGSLKKLKEEFYTANELSHTAENRIEDLLQSYNQLREDLQDLPRETVSGIVREMNEHFKALRKWKGALRKQLEENQEAQITKLEKLHQTLFPENTPQERHDNFIGFYLNYKDRFFELLLENFDPTQREMKVVME